MLKVGDLGWTGNEEITKYEQKAELHWEESSEKP